jgi:hypothetical protein
VIYFAKVLDTVTKKAAAIVANVNKAFKQRYILSSDLIYFRVFVLFWHILLIAIAWYI